MAHNDGPSRAEMDSYIEKTDKIIDDLKRIPSGSNPYMEMMLIRTIEARMATTKSWRERDAFAEKIAKRVADIVESRAG